MTWAAIAETILAILLCISFYLAQPIATTRVVQVPQGSINNLVASLKARGYDLSKADSLLLRFFGLPQKGWIDLEATELARGDFFYRLVRSKAAMTEVTLIPGETTVILLGQLAASLGLNEKLLEYYYTKYAPSPEGVLFPDTYRVPVGIDEAGLVRHLVNLGMARHRELSKMFFGEYEEERWFRYVTVASIVQKEAADAGEMPLVASVVYNRLNKGMRLQMDGTLNYGKYSHRRVTPERIRSDQSGYNTYRNKGLPPAPVALASLEALRAAVFPAKTDYLYFVRNKEGTHTFTKSYTSHLGHIKNGKK